MENNLAISCDCITRLLLGGLTAGVVMSNFVGCASTTNSVIASTGTTIGVELSQNQTTQTPIAILGYKRAEIAYVPTNRGIPTEKTTKDDDGQPVVGQKARVSTIGMGARDSANVLMELRYSGIFDWGPTSGIYQRLAVGDKAVSQPGASFMFSKDHKGEIDDGVAKYVAEAQREITIEQERIDHILDYLAGGNGRLDSTKLNNLLEEAKKNFPKHVTETVANEIKRQQTASDLRLILSDHLDAAVEPLYKSLPIEAQ